jgi:hypothetical protein
VKKMKENSERRDTSPHTRDRTYMRCESCFASYVSRCVF